MGNIRYCLLVDDDPDDQEMFLAATREVYPSITCTVEHDPEKALLLLESRKQNPDMIFVNINMPKINGYEFLVHLKGKEQLKDIPVIFYSTTAEPSAINKAMALGASGFITKRRSHQELCKTLKESYFLV